MTNHLQNLTFLVTRPDPGGTALCQAIRDWGGEALHCPTIDFAPPTDLSAIQHAMTILGQQDWLIFVSPQAVYASIPTIRSAWPHFPPQLKLAAVGAATATALQEAGYAEVVYPNVWNSENLLALAEFNTLIGKKVAIICGAEGRDVLQQTLIARGADVLEIIAYNRVLPNLSIQVYLSFLQQQAIDAVIAASFTSVKHLKILMGESAWPLLQNVPLVVVSERIKRLAQGLGFRTIWVAANASHAAILNLLAQKRNEQCLIKQTKL